MRLDKYLKVSRIIKRRTVAKQAAEKKMAEWGCHAGKAWASMKKIGGSVFNSIKSWLSRRRFVELHSSDILSCKNKAKMTEASNWMKKLHRDK